MASLRTLCFVLLFMSILICQEARPLPSLFLSNNQNHTFERSVKQMLKEITRRKQLQGTNYELHRLSPGGPDPRHH
ncbi:hypothetical protein Lal_00034983 [Lupinus albus]|uniref:Uncharacterized protein n=1 Tax=Lupinus albus TaxID=3870 RepID=A0A6A5PKV4_LUPAL|nr:hypothetical protein Lalb_Chr03g0031051 [Lupinus albus]KAF1897280.1 hypothetical protein Lal_00034983 [Lupinus albus]